MLPPLKPLPMKDRLSMVFVQYGQIDVRDGAFVVIDQTGVRMHIPVGSVACIMLEPGTRVSHAAVHLASTVGTLLVWVGEAGGVEPPSAPPESVPSAIPNPEGIGDLGHRTQG
ncbi:MULTISPECIES: hypothetical protein [Pseudomonas]|jgi:Uncharacterized protein predicted to be involved in DNA repair|nr:MULTISPECIES: hypothetical protein [Pseudomonas]EAZ57059.1 hypothetical protein PA2G_00235 [Pseudomonas aeruginosa 2192]MBB4847308.1 hypothetical protein [Pseudomonas aeruginosa]MCC0145242.1 hypothetical protein [Pseudomonas aeruginosa]MCC8903687.1 hypothetical protein [Pseudomonas aeruginosa]MCS8244399.1 hypothetical protein [Pseudomonas aeruginosa]